MGNGEDPEDGLDLEQDSVICLTHRIANASLGFEPSVAIGQLYRLRTPGSDREATGHRVRLVELSLRTLLYALSNGKVWRLQTQYAK
jgi:hypothetical protein